MKCPVCNEPLQIAVRAGIEIDYCATCRGVWLDRGELDKIIERHLQEMHGVERAAPPAPHPAPHRSEPRRPAPRYEDDDYEDDDRHKRKRRKKRDWLEDLFDIFD